MEPEVCLLMSQMPNASDVGRSPAEELRPAASQVLRFITCGSPDDGKSTLIGRLLTECNNIPEDQVAASAGESKKVAYRFFATERRKFVVADASGHEQYTLKMVTGAWTADLALILVDARKGVITQTRRHIYLVSLLGIRRVVLVVNKMDLVGYARD